MGRLNGQGGWLILESIMAGIIMLVAIAGFIAASKQVRLQTTSPQDPNAGVASQNVSMMLLDSVSGANWNSGDPLDPWTAGDHPTPILSTHENVNYSTTYTVVQPPGGRDYRIAKVTTTWTDWEFPTS